MENLNKTDIGLIGLAVMGENLALNMADKGWRVSVYNRTVPGIEEGVVERFINGRAQGKSIEGYTDIARFVESVAVPRKIMIMVRAGSAELFKKRRTVSVANTRSTARSSKGKSSSQGDVTYHRIRNGETLSTIARKYGVTVNQIKSWNGLRSTRINAGKRLKIYK